MPYVDNSQITPLYANTTPGVTADPNVVDPAIAAIVQAINDNWAIYESFVTNVTLPIPDQSIVERHIRNLAITNPKLAPSAVTNDKIADSTITAAKLADLLITTSKLADLSVTNGKLVALSVTGDKIANSTITTEKLQDLLITTAKLGDGSVIESKLSNGAVSTRALSDRSVTASKLDPSLINPISDAGIQYQFGLVNEKLTELEASEVNVVIDFGADPTGVSDSTNAFNNANSTGKNVAVPPGTYRISSLSGTNLYFYGRGHESTTIITTGNIVFPNSAKGDIEGITFKASVADTTTLFKNESDTYALKCAKCYFEDYEYTLNLPTYGNSFSFDGCYFRSGVVGIYANYAHNISITRCIFWQQKQYSHNLNRGTGSSVRNNNYVATNGKPATARFFSQQCSFEDNYMEMYDTTGVKNSEWIRIEYNNVSLLPEIRSCMINGDNAMDYCINLVGTQVNNNRLIIENCELISATTLIGGNLNNLSSLSLAGTTGYLSSFPAKRYYRSKLNGIDVSTGTNVVVPIDSGAVYDPYKLATGSNTIKAYQAIRVFKLTVSGWFNASVVNTGLVLKLRDTNGSTIRQFIFSSPYAGEIPFVASMVVESVANSTYRVDFNNISGVTRPTTMDILVELEEI